MQLDKKYFGEGISILKGKIYQLTWQTNKVFVYDSASWKKLKELDWPHEGWGMTHDSTHLIISIGDSNLYFVNPEDFKLSNILAVSDNNGPVGNLNELEYVNGYIYANQYLTNNILKINAQTGRVEARADLTNIMNANGVHFDAQKS